MSREGHGLCMGDFMLTELGGHYGMVFAAVLAAACVSSPRLCRKRADCCRACGCEITRFTSERRAPGTPSRFCVTGCYILLNAGIVNLGGGFFCPFVTYGRGGMLLTSVLLGILLSVYRHQNVLPKDTAVERLGRIRVTVLPE